MKLKKLTETEKLSDILDNISTPQTYPDIQVWGSDVRVDDYQFYGSTDPWITDRINDEAYIAQEGGDYYVVIVGDEELF